MLLFYGKNVARVASSVTKVKPQFFQSTLYFERQSAIFCCRSAVLALT